MIRPYPCILAAGMALATAGVCGAGESFPVVHNEPLTVRILSGWNGQPLAHLHLLLIGGYDRADLHDQLFRQETLTDAQGQARLSKRLAQLPWLQVWVNKKPLCQAHPRSASFSVELIRRDGLSTPNRCGTANLVDTPGVFTVFVDGKAKNASAESIEASATMQTPITEPAAMASATAKAVLAPVAVEAFTQKPVEAAAPAQKPAESVLNPLALLPVATKAATAAAGAASLILASSSAAASSIPVSPPAAMQATTAASAPMVLPEASASPQVKEASKADTPAKATSTDSATALAQDGAKVPKHDTAKAPSHSAASASARVRARQPIRQVAGRRAAYNRTRIQARRKVSQSSVRASAHRQIRRPVAGRPSAPRARVIMVSCPVRQRRVPAASAGPVKTQSKLPATPAATPAPKEKARAQSSIAKTPAPKDGAGVQSKLAETPATTTDAGTKPKPAAGVRLKAGGEKLNRVAGAGK